MITIRPSQLDTLHTLSRDACRDDVERWARGAHPERFGGAATEGTRQLIRRAVARATEVKIEHVDDVTRFVDLMLRLGEDFEQRPQYRPIARLVCDRRLPATARLDVVDAVLDRCPHGLAHA